MPKPLVPQGTGTANVLMVNNGHLALSTMDTWYDTTDDSDITPPVMCFVIERDGKHYLWDLGMRPDIENVNIATRSGWKRAPPSIRRPLPASLPANLAPSAVYLSHYHWDHSGDVAGLPPDLPVYVGAGSIHGIRTGGLGKHVGSVEDEHVGRLTELPAGTVQVDGFPDLGVDVFSDGSFVVVPGPGHCAGHSIAIVRVQSSPDAYIVLGGDAGHNRAVYDPCPCHGATAGFSTKRPIHQDEPAARETIARVSGVHARDDVWVILAHEIEVARTVPEDVWLGDWREKGWKDKVAAERRRGSEKGCFAGERT